MGRRRSIGEGSVYFDAQKDRWVGAMIAEGRRYKVVAKTRPRLESGSMRCATRTPRGGNRPMEM